MSSLPKFLRRNYRIMGYERNVISMIEIYFKLLFENMHKHVVQLSVAPVKCSDTIASQGVSCYYTHVYTKQFIILFHYIYIMNYRKAWIATIYQLRGTHKFHILWRRISVKDVPIWLHHTVYSLDPRGVLKTLENFWVS